MATTRTANAHWEGSLLDGKGQVTLASSGLGTFDVTWPARSEDAQKGLTSPEELIAAAHSTCFSMALSHALAGGGHPAETIDTQADVTFQAGKGITGIHLTTRASVPGLTAEQFLELAEQAKQACPVSAALTGTTITLDASLD
ncbi:MAG: lipoyl-dependent peroxiredoxin [Actinomycetota bacterium]|jgi:osmotically inducible protein OsmC|nr:lipoyl-dependent peroxiredoxin [Actinomycetota bacterium]